MNKVDKCYIYTKEYSCFVEEDIAQECFIFQFGDGELFDKDGDSFFVYCEFDYQTQKEIIQLWYEDYVETIYLKEPSQNSFIITKYLSKEDINEILREFHVICNIKEEN